MLKELLFRWNQKNGVENRLFKTSVVEIIITLADMQASSKACLCRQFPFAGLASMVALK